MSLFGLVLISSNPNLTHDYANNTGYVNKRLLVVVVHGSLHYPYMGTKS